jgi:tRNA (guanine37-N1)-methyltransferase
VDIWIFLRKRLAHMLPVLFGITLVVFLMVRLIPGVLGNPESLAEESHNSDGYLEYPNFTKPQEWRGFGVPEILLSGNHGEIAKWRELQAQKRAKKNI